MMLCGAWRLAYAFALLARALRRRRAGAVQVSPASETPASQLLSQGGAVVQQWCSSTCQNCSAWPQGGVEARATSGAKLASVGNILVRVFSTKRRPGDGALAKEGLAREGSGFGSVDRRDKT